VLSGESKNAGKNVKTSKRSGVEATSTGGDGTSADTRKAPERLRIKRWVDVDGTGVQIDTIDEVVNEGDHLNRTINVLVNQHLYLIHIFEPTRTY